MRAWLTPHPTIRNGTLAGYDARIPGHGSSCAVENCLVVQRRKEAGMVEDIEHFDPELAC